MSWPTTYAREWAAARDAIAEAGRRIMDCYTAFTAIPDAPTDISTDADRLAQETILQHLAQQFPDDAFCAEEATPTLANLRHAGPRLWIIDPIDGTRGFARKNGEFSVMVALAVEGGIALGIVLEPAQGRCTYAVRGEGCWRRDQDGVVQRCQVSATAEPEHATLVRSRSDKETGRQATLDFQRVQLTYSAGIKLAFVARGEGDVYVSRYHRFHAWDIGAGHILVEEAGGRVTNMLGAAITYAPDGSGAIAGIVASNGHLHEAALARLKEKS
jgi:3'(2'), 5'-bisphosphate nucleotidase